MDRWVYAEAVLCTETKKKDKFVSTGEIDGIVFGIG
jgi:hypothetical protein